MDQCSFLENTENDTKSLGAYYTDELVAGFLVRWAVRSRNDHVMDPSFGDGVFLTAACERLAGLGGNASTQVLGIEIDPGVYAKTLSSLVNRFGLTQTRLKVSDFFELPPGSKQVEAAVGNPPFIRYQRFKGELRKRAIRRASSQGVQLTELTSSWAPFLIHTISMIKPGGRLAMVVPFEISHAAYARPVLQYLAASFGKVTFLTFRRKIFSRLNEDTLLVLADHKDAPNTQFCLRDLSSIQDLTKIASSEFHYRVEAESTLDHEAICRGDQRLLTYFLPERVRTLYQEIKKSPEIELLGSLAYVGIGYVTGSNDYFHLGPAQVRQWQIPNEFLKPALRRGRILSGIRFGNDDWEAGLQSGETGYLLHIGDQKQLPRGVVSYLEQGIKAGIPEGYKCRTRHPWYRVPNVFSPDAFLTYMSGHYPKLVANIAGVVAPNSLHVVRLTGRDLLRKNHLAALWLNSLTGLSAEIEGHSLGGGMLKLEPTEARNVLIPVVSSPRLSAMETELDEVCRERGVEQARKLADEQLLRRELGLTGGECKMLQDGIRILMNRRQCRNQGY